MPKQSKPSASYAPAPRVFLHAGFHKTGTTSFQTFLERNRAAHPPDFAFYGKAKAHVAALHCAVVAHCHTPCARTREVLAAAARALADEVADAGHTRVLVSLESLCGAMPEPDGTAQLYPFATEVLIEVEAAFAPGLAGVFLSTRARDAWTRSVYKHLVKSRGLNMDFETFSDAPKFRDHDWAATVLDVTRKLDCEIVAAPMEQDAATPFGPGATFLSHMGFAPEDLAAWETPARKNAGLNDKTIAALQTAPLKLMPALVRKSLAKAIDRFV